MGNTCHTELKLTLYVSRHHLKVKLNITEATKPTSSLRGKAKFNNLLSVFSPTIYDQHGDTSEGVELRSGREHSLVMGKKGMCAVKH